MNALVPTQTIEQICAFRDEAIRHFEIAFGKIEEAAAAVAQANTLWEGGRQVSDTAKDKPAATA